MDYAANYPTKLALENTNMRFCNSHDQNFTVIDLPL